MTKDKDGLTPMQARFAVEYPKDHNGKQAAIRAGSPPKNAEIQASKWLRLPKVRSVIERIEAKVAKKCELDAEAVLRESKRIMFSNIGDLWDNETGDWKPIKDWPEDARRAIASIKKDRRGKLDITFWNKDKHLEMGLKMTGQLSDSLRIGPLDAKTPAEIEAIWGRCQSLKKDPPEG